MRDYEKRVTKEDIQKALEALGLRNNECVEPKPIIEIKLSEDHRPAEIRMERRNEQ